jgi:hypothetical protein
MKFHLSKTVSINRQISNLIKIHPAGAELFHAGGQTGMTQLIVAFHNFANAPKNEQSTSHPDQFTQEKRHGIGGWVYTGYGDENRNHSLL